MTDDPTEPKNISMYDLYDQAGEDAGLIVPRPDHEDAVFYLATKVSELDQVKEELLQQEKAGWPDIRAFTAKKSQRDALLRIFS